MRRVAETRGGGGGVVGPNPISVVLNWLLWWSWYDMSVIDNSNANLATYNENNIEKKK